MVKGKVNIIPFKNKSIEQNKSNDKNNQNESNNNNQNNVIELTLPNKNLTHIPPLAEWDHKSLPDHFFMVCEGKRRTGKSTFCKWLLQYYQDRFPLAWCMTNTKASGYWQEIVGEAFTFDGWYPSAIEKVIRRNDKIIEKYGEHSEITKQLGSVLIILDDIISTNIHRDETFIKLAVEGRHHLISIMLLTQDPKAICPAIRDNADVAVIFNQKTFRNKESIWHDFMNDIPKDLSEALLAKYAINHDALIAIQTNLNSDINKCFFKSTGDKTKLRFPNYALGGEEQRKLIFKEREAKKEKERMLKMEMSINKVKPERIDRLTYEEATRY